MKEENEKLTWETPEVVDLNVDDTTTPKSGPSSDGGGHTPS